MCLIALISMVVKPTMFPDSLENSMGCTRFRGLPSMLGQKHCVLVKATVLIQFTW